jgi:hypothetical protein
MYMNRGFGGTYHLHLQGRKSADHETTMQQVTCPEDVNITDNLVLGFTIQDQYMIRDNMRWFRSLRLPDASARPQ